MAVKSYQAGVTQYRQSYWQPDYMPLDTDILACRVDAVLAEPSVLVDFEVYEWVGEEASFWEGFADVDVVDIVFVAV